MNDGRREDPHKIGTRRLSWLQSQAQQWQQHGLITADQRSAILEYYGTEDYLKQQYRHRAFMALVGLGIVMIGAGVLLLIGHNWQEISRIAKVILIFASVLGAFLGSWQCYRTHRPVGGEALALLGTLLFGCAIWLLAQVYHIERHYPDGLMWWMIGSLITAWAVRSRLITVEAVILLTMWGISEIADFSQPNYPFLGFALLIGGLGVMQRSSAVVMVTALALAIWLLLTGAVTWRADQAIVPVLLLLGCAYYAVSLTELGDRAGARSWSVLGLAIVLASLAPLTSAGIFDSRWSSLRGNAHLTPLFVTATVLAAWSIGVMIRAGRSVLERDWPILLTLVLGVAALIYMLVPVGIDPHIAGTAFALGFSALTLVLSVWLILRGVRLDRALSFFTGVIYMLVFVLVRWIDLIGDMVSSAMVFFVAGAALLAAAIYWRRRPTGPYRPLRAEEHHA